MLSPSLFNANSSGVAIAGPVTNIIHFERNAKMTSSLVSPL